MSTWPNKITIGTIASDMDAPGDYRLTTNVEGWGSPPRRLNQQEATGRDGVWVSGAFYGARTIVHSGMVEQATSAAAQSLADDLAALPAGALTTYTVSHDTIGARYVAARVAVGADPQWIDDRSFTYSITLVAPDPFKRPIVARTVTVGVGATVSETSPGKVYSEIEVTLTSGGTVDLTIAGLRLRTASLPSGAVLTSGPGFARPKRTIRSSTGGNLFGSIVQPMQWPAMVPGVNSIHQAGTAGLSIRYFPTYA